MDAKALAKSKRSHSQHNKRPHQGQIKASSSSGAGTSNTKKPQGQQAKEKIHPSLPSNWDRYEEDIDSGSEDASARYSEVIAPKSKGADFRYLISQAQEAQAQPLYDPYLDSSASLEDILPDFKQGVGSMLSARGQRILSQVLDDNFIVEDRAMPSYEAPFLSLNLHSLAEQLSKVDLPQRLFIEADMLPPELCTKVSDESGNQKPFQMVEAGEIEAGEQLPSKSDFHDVEEVDKIADSSVKATPPDTTTSNQVRVFSKPPSEPTDASKEEKQKPSRFEAAMAEAELDMLLDSFSETKLLDNSLNIDKPSTIGSSSFPPVSSFTPQTSGKEPDSYKNASSIGFDDAVDDLLRKPVNIGEEPRPKAATPGSQRSPLLESGSSSKILDDFDSWLDTI